MWVVGCVFIEFDVIESVLEGWRVGDVGEEGFGFFSFY